MITFSGLASGLDTGALIDQLVAAEKAPASGLELIKSALGRQRTVVDDLKSKLGALADAARGVDLASEARARAVSVSDTKVGVAVSSSAGIGAHTARVTQLAAAQVVASKVVASDAPGVLGAGGVQITIGGVPTTINWTAADSLSAIAQRINDNTTGLDAAVLNTGSGYQIVVTASATGTANAATYVDSGGVGAALDFGVVGATKVAAANLGMTIDGIAITRSSNVVSDALPGITFTANAVHDIGDPDTTIGVTSDRDAIQDKVQGLVDAYNAVAKLLDGQLRYDGQAKGQDTLFGDSTARRLQSALAAISTSAWGGRSLRDLGITRSNSGELTLDKTKFQAALDADGDAIEDVLATGGLAAAISGLADQYTRAGDGILAEKVKSLQTRQDVYAKQIASIERNAEALGARLAKQFTALEEAMTLLQGQANYLAGLVAR